MVEGFGEEGVDEVGFAELFEGGGEDCVCEDAADEGAFARGGEGWDGEEDGEDAGREEL